MGTVGRLLLPKEGGWQWGYFGSERLFSPNWILDSLSTVDFPPLSNLRGREILLFHRANEFVVVKSQTKRLSAD